MTLTEKINELAQVGGLVSVAEVLELVKDAVVIEVDTERHSEDPADETSRIVWATLDTAWNVICEGAVKAAIQDVRESVDHELPSDEEMFKQFGVSGYRELYPVGNMQIASMLAEIGDALAEEAFNDMKAGLGL